MLSIRLQKLGRSPMKLGQLNKPSTCFVTNFNGRAVPVKIIREQCCWKRKNYGIKKCGKKC